MGKRVSDIDLLLISDLYPSPTEKLRGIFVRDHARAIKPFVRSVTVADIRFSGEKVELRRDELDPDIRLLQGGVFPKGLPKKLRTPLYELWARKACRKIRSHSDPDLIHAHGGVLSGTLARRLASKKGGIPFFITEHFLMLDRWAKHPVKRRLLQKNYGRAAQVTGVSEHLSEQIKRRFPATEPLSVPNPVDTKLFHPGNEARSERILFASRLDPNKGALRTLRAFDAIHEEHPDWVLEISGEGPEKEALLSYLEKRPSLKSRVELGPTLSREGLSEKMRKASFLVLPSAYESFGLVIAEALASGTPVIAPDHTAPPELLFEGAGISIDSLDEEAVAKAMKRMVGKGVEKSPEELHRRIEERYGMERVGRTWSELYQKALGDP